MGEIPDISPLVILCASIFTSNMVLVNFLGMCLHCHFFGVQNCIWPRCGSTLVMVITTSLNCVVPLDLGSAGLEYLVYLVHCTIAAVVQIFGDGPDRYRPRFTCSWRLLYP